METIALSTEQKKYAFPCTDNIISKKISKLRSSKFHFNDKSILGHIV